MGKLYKGFLHLKCPHCGHVMDTCIKNEQDSFTCKKCKRAIPMTEDVMVRADLRCECGKRAWYWTNRKEALFDMTCIECTAPVAVEWNRRKRRYTTIEE